MAANPNKRRGDEPRYIAVNPSGLQLPWSDDAERAVLADCMVHPENLDLVDLQVPEFFGSNNRKVWSVLRDLRDAGRTVDMTTVVTELRAREQLTGLGNDAVQGVTWLTMLVDATPSTANVAGHALLVREYAQRRAIIEAAQGITGDGLKDERRGSEFALWASTMMERACGGATAPGHVAFTMRDAAAGRREALRQQWAGKRSPWGLRGPLRMLNVLSHGLKLGSFSILAGMTSSGKTVLAQQEAETIAGTSYTFAEPDGSTTRADCGVLYLSLEMPRDLLVDRHVCRHASVTQKELQSGRQVDEEGKVTKQPLDSESIARIDHAFNTAHGQPILYVTGGFNIDSVRSWVKRAQAHFRRETIRRNKRDADGNLVPLRLALVVLDHVHLMDENDDREVVLALGRVAKALKRIAVDELLHVRALAQFNRETAKRGEGGLPQIYDIKYASAMEQAADQIHLVHRAFLTFEDRSSEAAQAVKNVARVIIGKARDGGELGHVECVFAGEYFRFEERAA